MSRWIKCSDQLPDSKQPVIMIAVGVGPRGNYTTDQYCGWLSGEWSSPLWVRWPHVDFAPTHWAEQPEPPK